MNHSLKQTNIKIASRGSTLALWQANHVKSLLKEQDCQADISVIKTTGDKIKNRFLHEIGGKGLFVKEIEQALLEKNAEIAVHSLKDLPATTPAPFTLAAILKRHSPFDIMIFKPEYWHQMDLSSNPQAHLTREALARLGPLKIATGSLRRSSLLREASPAIQAIPIRGNVDTRIEKLMTSDWHSLILAEASMQRLEKLDDLKWMRLDPSWFVPCAAQGALVIETLQNNPIINTLKTFDCTETRRDITIERLVLKKLGGDCTMPFGCYFKAKKGKLIGDAVILNESGDSCRATLTTGLSSANKENCEEIANIMINKLKANGANRILTSLNLPSIE